MVIKNALKKAKTRCFLQCFGGLW